MMLGDNVDNRGRARDLLGLVELADRLDHKPKELSGGEQQRVAIARALINKPRILFADEPCANLDTISSKLVMDTLVKLNSDLGLTIVYVSHDPDDKQYAQNIIYLKDGKQVAEYI
jgi:putative ABC transport system ATP-binding protein